MVNRDCRVAAFPTAHGFRRFLQKHLPPHLDESPAPDPLSELVSQGPVRLPEEVTTRWPEISVDSGNAQPLSGYPIDHSVAPALVIEDFNFVAPAYRPGP